VSYDYEGIVSDYDGIKEEMGSNSVGFGMVKDLNEKI